MKKQVYRLFAMAGMFLAITVTSAHAQSARLIVANIPFNFVVKDKALPAGEYTIEPVQIGASQALKLQSRDGHITAIVAARYGLSRTNPAEPMLVFNRFGERYFLSEILGFEEKATYTLPKSRTEDRFAKGVNARKPVRVSIAGEHK